MIRRADDPFQLFDEWQREARGDGSLWRTALRHGARLLLGGDLPEADAAALATISPDGQPAVRMVLVKTVKASGLLFYTSYLSRKARELDATPRAALAFHWPAPPRQVRVEGPVTRVDRALSEAYFAARSRGSQLSATASRQSAVLEDRATLVARVAELSQRYRGQSVPCPETWGGYRLLPEVIEFWEGRTDRLHERLCYERSPGEPERWRSFGREP
jgi:pyridoxamine 5'-phosphate oxidase